MDRRQTYEIKLMKYVTSKMDGDMASFYHADLEPFGIDDKTVNVWVFANILPSEVSRDIIEKWFKDHIKEERIAVTEFEIEELFDRTNPKETFVTLI